MFFELMNLPAIFQAIMDELLRDLINTGKMGSFIDDIIVETESKERYNKLVEEILRKLEENDLYIKSEMLQLKPLVLDRRRTLYRVYTRELDRELHTGLSTLYTNT